MVPVGSSFDSHFLTVIIPIHPLFGTTNGNQRGHYYFAQPLSGRFRTKHCPIPNNRDPKYC
jgi:prephenate dehydrogenase